MLNELGLFFGSLLDSLIGPNLFVPGEPFLLAAGYQLYQGAIWGVAAVLLGGWIGDQSSYWIGRRSGKRLLSIVTSKRPKTRRSFARARLLMQKHGIKVMLFSRLLGLFLGSCLTYQGQPRFLGLDSPPAPLWDYY